MSNAQTWINHHTALTYAACGPVELPASDEAVR